MAVQLTGWGQGFSNETDVPPFTGQLTYCFWYRTDVAENTMTRDIYTLWTDNVDPFNTDLASWWVYLWHDALWVWFMRHGVAPHLVATTPMAVGDWHHLAVVSDGTTHRAYVDGVQEGGDLTANIGGIGTQIYEVLGDWEEMVGLYSVAYFRLWTAALSQPEIAAEMAATAAVRTAALYRDVPLETVDGSDTSGNGHPFAVFGTGLEPVTGPLGGTVSASPATPPDNDTCETATPVSTLPYTIIIDNTEATDDTVPEGGEGWVAGVVQNGVWYALTVPADVYRVVVSVNDGDLNEGSIRTFTGTCEALVFADYGFQGHDILSVVWPGDVLYVLVTTFSHGGLPAITLSLSVPVPTGPTGDFCVVLTSPSASPSQEPVEDTPRRIRRLRQSPHLTDEKMWLYVSSFQLDLEMGRGNVTDPGLDPQVMLQYSNDGGHTWSDEMWVSAGLQGQYAYRALWRRLGKSRDRVWRVVMDAPIPWHLLDAYVRVNKGIS